MGKRRGGNEESASTSEEEENETQNCLSGFIFLCNQRTKLECYQYRVFGLPFGQREVLEEIKPGAKLFLFDFESKLLYGIYEATSAGALNMEPAAFGGKFPAQVRFRIFKECLPLTESNLRRIIKENYSGSKFKQELSGKQVKTLSSSFQPLTPSQHAYQASPNVSQFQAYQAAPNVSQFQTMPPLARENQFKHRVRHLPVEVPYLTEMQYDRASQLQPATVPNVHFWQQGYHRTKYETALVHQLRHQSFPPTGGYNDTNSQQPYFPRGVSIQVHEPYSRTILQRAPHDQVTNMGSQYQQLPSHMEPHYRGNVTLYNSYQQSPVPCIQSAVQPATAQYPSPVMQPASAQYSSSVMQRASTQYPSSVVLPASAQYASLVMQPDSAYYTSSVMQPASAQYASSVMHGTYHSYSGAT